MFGKIIILISLVAIIRASEYDILFRDILNNPQTYSGSNSCKCSPPVVVLPSSGSAASATSNVLQAQIDQIQRAAHTDPPCCRGQQPQQVTVPPAATVAAESCVTVYQNVTVYTTVPAPAPPPPPTVNIPNPPPIATPTSTSQCVVTAYATSTKTFTAAAPVATPVSCNSYAAAPPTTPGLPVEFAPLPQSNFPPAPARVIAPAPAPAPPAPVSAAPVLVTTSTPIVTSYPVSSSPAAFSAGSTAAPAVVLTAPATPGQKPWWFVY